MKGYGWCFRKGVYLNIGLGRADPHLLPAHIASFLAFLKASGRLSFDIPALRGPAYLIRGVSTRRIAEDAVLLIRDAAGPAYPQSGEGIRPAIESGLFAARIIAAARGAYSRERLAPHTAQVNPSPRLPQFPWAAPLARHLLKSRWFVRQILLDRCFLRHLPSTAPANYREASAPNAGTSPPSSPRPV